MKSLARSFLINAASLWLVDQLVHGFSFANGNQTVIVAALALGLVNLFIRPLINLLLLPINLLTLGTFRWVVNVIALFVVTLVVPGFQVVGFNFAGFTLGALVIPAYTTVGILAFILNSFLLSLISGFFFWLEK